MSAIIDFLKVYGLGGLLVFIIAYGLTEAIKIPLKEKAEKWATNRGYDKIVVTQFFIVLPLVLAFAGSLIHVWAVAGWGKTILDTAKFPWYAVGVETAAVESLSVIVYNIVENAVKAATTKKIAKLAKSANPDVAEAQATIASAAVTEADKQAAAKAEAKAKLKAQEEADKAAKKTEKEAEAKKAEADKKAKQIAELQAKLAELEGTSTTASTTSKSDKTVSVTADNTVEKTTIKLL